MVQRLDMIASPAVTHLRQLARTDPAVDWLLQCVEVLAIALERYEDANEGKDIYWTTNTDMPLPPRMPKP